MFTFGSDVSAGSGVASVSGCALDEGDGRGRCGWRSAAIGAAGDRLDGGDAAVVVVERGDGERQGGACAAAIRSAVLRRRRLRRLGGSPRAARRCWSAWRAAKA